MKLINNKLSLLLTVILLIISLNIIAKPPKSININGYTQLYPYKVHLSPKTNSAYGDEIHIYLPQKLSYRDKNTRGDFIETTNEIILDAIEAADVKFQVKYRTDYFIITSEVHGSILVEKLKELETIESLKEDVYYDINKKQGIIISEDNSSIVYKYELQDFMKNSYTRFVKIFVKDDIKLTIISDYSHFSPGIGDLTKALDLLTKVFEKISAVDGW